MSRYRLLLALLAIGLAVGCGGGTGPVKVDIPDFYPPAISGLSYQPQPPVAGADLTIVATVTDNSGAATVALKWRKIGTTDFADLAPANSLAGVHTFLIPGAQVASPGVEYYLTATDGANTTTDPSSAPATLYQVLINYVTVTHNAITQARSASPLLVSATIVSDTVVNQAASGFRYRAVGAAAFTQVLFGTKSGDIYSATWPAVDLVDGTTYEYYVFAASQGGATREFPENASTGNTFLRLAASSAVNNKPIAIPTGPATATVGQEIQLNASYNDDGPGPYSYTWSKAAGTTLDLSTYDSAVTSLKPIQTGAYTYNLVVSDGKVTSDPVPFTVTVTSPTLTGTIGSQTLYAASSPYVVQTDVTVPVGATLKIERGVTLRFKSNTGLFVNGTLDASGSADSPIVFTSDTTLPIKGFWKGVFLSNTPRLPQSTINFATIQYSRDGIVLTNADSPTISECTITLNENQGIYCDNSTVTVNKCQFIDNGTDGVYCVGGSTATLSSNVIQKNSRNGIYCEGSRIEMAKNDVTENKYGVFIVACRGVNVVNIQGNKFYSNADGIRIQDSDPVVQSNDIYANKDNGILAYSIDAAEIAAGRFTAPNITSNAIHNNRDDGIHLEDCYPLPRRAWNDDAHQFSEIYSNVIAFSGGEAIECKGSSPIIHRNIIGMSSDNAIFCTAGAAPLNRPSSPFLKANSIIGSSRAAIAVVGDAFNGGANAPEAWWNDLYGNNLIWIDYNSPGTELAIAAGGVTGNGVAYTGLDLGAAPGVVSIDGDGDPLTANFSVVADNAYATGGRTYYKYTGDTAPAAGDRFGWNLNEDPLWDHASVNAAKWEDPFATSWLMKSEKANPRYTVEGKAVFQTNYPTSGLLNSGEPLALIPDGPAFVAPTDPVAGIIGGSMISNPALFITIAPNTYLKDGNGNYLLNIQGLTGVVGAIRYANYQNADLAIGKWVASIWPTK